MIPLIRSHFLNLERLLQEKNLITADQLTSISQKSEEWKRYFPFTCSTWNRAKFMKMKRLVFLVFFLAIIGLTQLALINMHRLRRVGSAGKEVTDLTRMEELTRTTSKGKWYTKSLWFLNKIIKDMMKNVERNELDKLYK